MQPSSKSNQPTGRRRSLKNRSILFGLMAALFLFAVGCTKDGQSTWEAFGPVAQKQLDLFNVILWGLGRGRACLRNRPLSPTPR